MQQSDDKHPSAPLQAGERLSQRRGWRHHAVLAACLLLILFASLQYGRVEPLATGAGIDRELLGRLQSEHRQNKQALLLQFAGSAPRYRAWETQLAQLEQAEQVVYNALRDAPTNLELLKLLRLLQQRQLDLLYKVFEAPASSI